MEGRRASDDRQANHLPGCVKLRARRIVTGGFLMHQLNRASLCATALGVLLGTYSAAAARDVAIRVLSGRADMVTGGNVLVETTATLEKFRGTLNGQDITASFRPGKTAGTLVARVEGLKPGKN